MNVQLRVFTNWTHLCNHYPVRETEHSFPAQQKPPHASWKNSYWFLVQNFHFVEGKTNKENDCPKMTKFEALLPLCRLGGAGLSNHSTYGAEHWEYLILLHLEDIGVRAWAHLPLWGLFPHPGCSQGSVLISPLLLLLSQEVYQQDYARMALSNLIILQFA